MGSKEEREHENMRRRMQRRHDLNVESLKKTSGAAERAGWFASLGHLHYWWAQLELQEARRCGHVSSLSWAPPPPSSISMSAAIQQRRQQLISACKSHVELAVRFYLSGKVEASRNVEVRDWLGRCAQLSAAGVVAWAEQESKALQQEEEECDDPCSPCHLSLIDVRTLATFLNSSRAGVSKNRIALFSSPTSS